MGILSGSQSNEPLHYGEVYAMWLHLHGAKAFVAAFQTLINHTGDEDLRSLISEIIEDSSKPEIQELEQILKEHGVGLPPTPPERADADLEQIPQGARFMDPEIANSLSTDLAAGLVSCSGVMGQCTREDIAAMYERFHTKKAGYALRCLKLQKEKGWLVLPPIHVIKPES